MRQVPKMFRICVGVWAVLLGGGIMLVQRNPEYVIKENIRIQMEGKGGLR